VAEVAEAVLPAAGGRKEGAGWMLCVWDERRTEQDAHGWIWISNVMVSRWVMVMHCGAEMR